MKKKLSSVSFWLIIFFSLIAAQAFSTFAQESVITSSGNNGSVGFDPNPNNRFSIVGLLHLVHV